MQILNPNVSIDNFYQKLRVSSRSLLLLDYDGTLAPFTADRDNAVPYDGIIDRLKILTASKNTSVIIISGRDIDTLKRLLSLEIYPEMFGCHGAEHLGLDGTYELTISKEIKLLLQQTIDWSREQLLERHTEIKPSSIAFHWRGMDFEAQHVLEQKILTYYRSEIGDSVMHLHSFDGGLEIRPHDIHKGTAINNILTRYDTDTVIAYLGDDLTDEDAFEVLADKGLKVLVNTAKRPTKADIQLTPPDELLDFIDRWIANIE